MKKYRISTILLLIGILFSLLTLPAGGYAWLLHEYK